MNYSKEASSSENSKQVLKEQLKAAPRIGKREARRKIKGEFKAAKEEAMVPAPVDERMKLRERILSLSLFPNTHNLEFLLSQS